MRVSRQIGARPARVACVSRRHQRSSMLVRNGVACAEVEPGEQVYSGIDWGHPRSTMGIDSDGYINLITVDGRTSAGAGNDTRLATWLGELDMVNASISMAAAPPVFTSRTVGSMGWSLFHRTTEWLITMWPGRSVTGCIFFPDSVNVRLRLLFCDIADF